MLSGADFTLAAALAWRKPAKPTSAHPEADVSSRVGTGSGNSSTPFGSVSRGDRRPRHVRQGARAQGCGRWLLRSAGPSDWKYCFRSRRGRVWRSGSCAKHGAEMARNSWHPVQRFRNDDRPVGMLVVESGSRPCVDFALQPEVIREFDGLRGFAVRTGCGELPKDRVIPRRTGQNWRAGQNLCSQYRSTPVECEFQPDQAFNPRLVGKQRIGWRRDLHREPLPSQSMADEYKAHRSSLEQPRPRGASPLAISGEQAWESKGDSRN